MVEGSQFLKHSAMTLQQSASEIACKEVLSPTHSLVKQFLAVHKVVMVNGVPSIARIDYTKAPESFRVYFHLEQVSYFLTIYVVKSTDNYLVVNWSDYEADVSVVLSVSSDLMAPDTITQQIGIKPTSTGKKGEPIPRRKNGILYLTNIWRFEPQKDFPDELERKLDFLLNQLENDATRISSISQQCKVYIVISYHGCQGQMGGWHLDTHTMSRILSLGADITLSLYSSGPDLPE